MVFNSPKFSRASPDLISIPCFVAWPIAAITAVGVANIKAHGQNTTKTVTPLSIFPVATHAAAAIIKATGTSHVAHLSAILWVGACFSSACFTKSINFWSDEFSLKLVVLISSTPYIFKVPQKTSSPSDLSTGRDSPVITDWSIELSPSITIPSTGIFSPGSTLKTSSILISSTEIIFSCLQINLPVWGVSSIKFFKPFLARSTVQSSRSAPSAIIHATSAAANISPITSEATIAIVINNADETHFSNINLYKAK